VSQFADRLLISLRTDWRGFAGGALLSASAAEVMELGADKVGVPFSCSTTGTFRFTHSTYLYDCPSTPFNPI